MNVSRRFFIGGAFGFLAGVPGRAFSAPSGTYASGKPRLSFGILSDVHVRSAKQAKGLYQGYDTETLETAFAYFRDQGADAVVIAGDMADSGMVTELQAVAAAWEKIFPGGKAPDGRKVERLFVTGNHDWNGMKRGPRVFADAEERKRYALELNATRHWDTAFHEEWKEMDVREVKGIPFVLAQWCVGDCRGKKEHFNERLKGFYEARRFDPALPLFHIQHPHPADTVHGPAVWGQDDGLSVQALAHYSNAIAFSGHSHTTITDERAIWQGAFTSLGCASMRYVGLGIPGFAPMAEFSQTLTGSKLGLENYMCRQGQFVRVYDDYTVVERREFRKNVALGADLVIPRSSDRPFAFAAREKKARLPVFPKGSELKVEKVRQKLKASRKSKSPARETEIYKITVPAVDFAQGARAAQYEVVARREAQVRKLGCYPVPGFRFPTADARATMPVQVAIATEHCPPAPFAFEVAPVSCWNRTGAPLTLACK